MSLTRKSLFILLVAALALTACSSFSASPTPSGNVLPVIADDFAVIAEGRVLPKASVNLSFSTGGKVVELLAAAGEAVTEGQVLARLENSAALQAQVAQAELEVLNARQAIDDLQSSAAIVKANAQFAIAQAQDTLDKTQRRLKNLTTPDLQFYQDRVDKAQDALTIAQQNGQLIDLTGPTAALKAAQDALDSLSDQLRDLNDLEARYPGGYTDAIKDAQKAYDKALDNRAAAQISLEQAQLANGNSVTDAQKALDDAQQALTTAQAGPKATERALAEANVALAEAALTDAQAKYEKVKNGPDPDQLTLAQARLATAQASVTAAKSALDNAELKAPIAGAVADLKLKVGEQVAPGQPAITLADFSGWKVETDNLTEIEVVKVKVGQGATVTLDALPGVKLRGTVESIGGVFEEKRGDVTYTVVIALTDRHALMRWGMTAEITFDK